MTYEASTAPYAARQILSDSKELASALPDLMVQAQRIASTILTGWHGRRRSGPGETFWQFRTFVPGEAATGIDWRRSARDEHVYVREKEWEAAHTILMWADISPSMAFRSRLATASKRDRTIVLLLSLADIFARSGERVGLLGTTPPILSRNAAERIATALAHLGPVKPPIETVGLRRFSDLILIGDFLDSVEELEAQLAKVAAAGVRAHLVQVLDPVEETFPYAGRTEFRDPETGQRHILGRAEQYREDYQKRLADLRTRIGLYARRLDWTFLIHRTDQPATRPLLALHARLSDRGDRFGGRAA
jgi:uncharacterized protein (DUF58 family)